ncbi:MAG: hypothetical protein KKA90_01625 [Nanoarchaeota archaeon]|nr:hypothetical protein [Nanoarchaeota archaeon]
MACWVVPLLAMLIGVIGRKTTGRKDAQGFWLTIMLLGGALFGIIDHLWYGELLLIGPAWMLDLTLGGVITTGIITSWGVIVFKPKIHDSLRGLSYHLGILKKTTLE